MSTTTNQTIVVTGAGGFLGSAIVRQLKAQGFNVRGLLRNEKSAIQHDKVLDETVVGDIADPSVAEQLTDRAHTVIHTVSNFRALNDPPEAYTRTNVEGTRNMLHAAIKSGVSRFVHCSTIGVHGDVSSGPITESGPYNPGDLYQETKLESELLCQQFQETAGMEVAIVRPCSMFGPGDVRLLKLFKMMSKSRPLLIGDGQSNFHSLYIDDAAKAFILAATVPEAANQIFIVGQPSSVPLRQYLEAVSTSLGKQARFLRLPYWPFYVAAYVSEKVLGIVGLTSPLTVRRLRFFRNNRDFNVSKAREVLGFEAEVALDEGLRKTVDAYKEAGWL